MGSRILLVDDSATVRMQAGRALKLAGFEILEAVDGLDALEKLAGAPDVSLVVCDINMPRMSGVEFVEALAAKEGVKPHILMLTTEGHPHLVARARAAGARGWMSKPFKPEMLVATAKKLTGTA